MANTLSYTCIVIDDEENSRFLIKSKLEKLTVAIDVLELCANAQEALVSIVKHKPDFVCIDIQMPGMTGIELLECLNDIKPDLKVIIISAYSESIYFQKAIRSGVVDYLIKPFLIEELEQAVQHLISMMENHPSENQLRKLIGEVSDEHKLQFKTPTSSLFINPKEIVYAIADGKYSSIYLENGNTELVCLGISNLLDKLIAHKNFNKIDRFTIINSDYLYKVHPKFRQVVFRVNNKEIKLEVSLHGVEGLVSK